MFQMLSHKCVISHKTNFTREWNMICKFDRCHMGGSETMENMLLYRMISVSLLLLVCFNNTYISTLIPRHKKQEI